VEQIMSKFLPDVLVAQVLSELGIKNEKLQAELPRMVKKSVEMLASKQTDDGGWGWWEHDASHPFQTAYVMYGLTLAKKAGYPVPDYMYNRGLDALKRHFEKKDLDAVTTSYMLYSLALAEPTNKSFMENHAPRLSRFGNGETVTAESNYARALLALAYRHLAMRDKALALLAELEKGVRQRDSVCYWGPEEVASIHRWQDDSIEATAYALDALVTLKRESPLIPKAARWLLAQRVGNGWRSTKDTAAILYALVDYLKATKELEPSYTLKVYLNDQLVADKRVTSASLLEMSQDLLIDQTRLHPGENLLRLEKEGEGRLYYSAYLSYYSGEEGIPPSEHGFAVEREYSKLVPVKDAKGRWVYGLQPATGPLRSGDEIFVRLRVKADRGFEYAMIEDPLPSGFEVVKDDRRYTLLGEEPREEYDSEDGWGWWYAHREFRDEKAAFFATELPAGRWEFTYILRAEKPGTMHVMPTLASLMYMPEIGGSSEEVVFEVRE